MKSVGKAFHVTVEALVFGKKSGIIGPRRFEDVVEEYAADQEISGEGKEDGGHDLVFHNADLFNGTKMSPCLRRKIVKTEHAPQYR